jgi:hypothetical protein
MPSNRPNNAPYAGRGWGLNQQSELSILSDLIPMFAISENCFGAVEITFGGPSHTSCQSFWSL